MSENTSEIKDEATVKEFLKAGYNEEEIERMNDEEFIYTAVMLVDGMGKEEINKGLEKSREEVLGCVDERKPNLRKLSYEVLIKTENIFYKE